MSDPGLRLIFCTAPEDAAPAIARALLEARLIGCANLLPGARSLYWWEGELQDDAEVVMLMESPLACVEEALCSSSSDFILAKCASPDPSKRPTRLRRVSP